MKEVQTYRLKAGVEVAYRSFRPADARRCSKILLGNFEPLRDRLGAGDYKRIIEDVYSEANLPKIAQERDYRVVLVHGEVVGVVGFIPDSKTEGELSNLSLDPAFHGKGIGKLLAALQLLEKIEEGVTNFFGYCSAQSRPIYAKLGFTEQNRQKPEDITDGFSCLQVEVTGAFKTRVALLLDSIIEK